MHEVPTNVARTFETWCHLAATASLPSQTRAALRPDNVGFVLLLATFTDWLNCCGGGVVLLKRFLRQSPPPLSFIP